VRELSLRYTSNHRHLKRLPAKTRLSRNDPWPKLSSCFFETSDLLPNSIPSLSTVLIVSPENDSPNYVDQTRVKSLPPL
jgi:hypothetical protein